MSRVRAFLLVLGAWTVPAVLSTSLILVRPGGDGSGWWSTLLDQLPNWWIWAALTPVVLHLARRVPIEGPRWWTAVATHVALGTVVVVFYLALQAPFAIHLEGRAITPSSWIRAVGGGLTFQFVTHFVIYLAIVGVGHALATSARLRDRELLSARLETQLAGARVESLRAHLQPHFLFNTLHVISGMVREGDTTRAVRMISGLSGLLRHTLDQVTTPEIPLHEELEALERYIEIEEVRFEDRLEIERAIGAGLHDVLVPALLLQPLVENAVHHGIGGRAGSGRIRIEAVAVADRLQITIGDDGAGLPGGFDPEGPVGVGIGHTRTRLRELHGDAAWLEFRALHPFGTEVSVTLPLRRETSP